MKRRGTRRLLAAPVWAAIFLKVGPLLADDSAQPPDDKAAAAYQAALDLHQAGDLKGALASMSTSYRLSQRDELLYNIARIEAELGDCTASLSDYRRYLERVPQGRFREPAQLAAREMELTCGAPPASASPVEPPSEASGPAVSKPAPTVAAAVGPPRPLEPPEPAPSKARLPWLGWSAIATGTVAGLGAVYFNAQAIKARDKYQTAVTIENAGGALTDLSLVGVQKTNLRWAQVLGATGGALVVGGVLWLVLTPRVPSLASARVYVAPGLVATCFQQTF